MDKLMSCRLLQEALQFDLTNAQSTSMWTMVDFGPQPKANQLQRAAENLRNAPQLWSISLILGGR